MAFKKRTGFGAIEFLLITVILLVIGGLAWYALRPKTPTSASTASPSPATTSSPTPANSSSTSFYLNVPEMKLKLKVPNSLSGIYYSYSPTSNQADLSTRALVALDPQCAADRSSTAMIASTNSPDTVTTEGVKTTKEVYPDGITIDGTYYYLVLSNGPCADLSQVGETRNQMKSITIEQL